MFRYYIWRARYLIITLACLTALGTILAAVQLISGSFKDKTISGETTSPSPMFIVERTYTKEKGYSYMYSDGKYLYDNDFKRLPRLSPSGLDRIEIDIETLAQGNFKTYAGSHTIDPLSIDEAGFQYDIPYNYYGTQQDIALYIALMLGIGFEVDSLYETKDSAVLELTYYGEAVRLVVGRNRLRAYSKLIGIDEFE